ncbi:hypothetical protein [Cryptosporangium sp. NPDC048952]|uniref:hypothetical protein n=1 Tax=Cryptosporangium sp. NPDC048952 TaxID=3363961 RepID=UPI00370F7950
MSNDYLEHATVYFWDESGSFSAESERTGTTAHRPYPGRRGSTSKSRRCGGARPGTSETPRRHP